MRKPTGMSMAQTYVSGVASGMVGAIGSDDYWGTVGEAAWSMDTLASVATAGAGSLAGDLLGKLNMGDKMEKVLGFNPGQIGEMQQFNQFAGSLAGAGVSYAMTGEVTLNVLNLGFLAGDGNTALDRVLSTGLLEMRLGGEKGFGMSVGSGGTDVSIGTVATAMAGLAHWGKNADIEAAARRDSAENAATAMRGAYGFGDETDLAQLDSILKGETRILAGDAGEGAQTVAAGGTRYVIMNGVNEAVTDEQKLVLALTLSHESRRDGVADGSKAETQGAVLAHTEMAVRMLKDSATNSIMKNVINGSETLQMDLGKYMTAKVKGDDSIFADYVDEAYDSSADFWKLVKTENGYDLEWDGNLNIYDGKGTEDENLLLHYKDLMDKKITGDITFDVDGEQVTISADRMQEINMYNIQLAYHGLTMPTLAAAYLLNDGKMTDTEAKLVRDNIMKYPFLGVDMIAHYSARYVLNENELLSQMVMGDGVDEWTKPEDRDRAESKDTTYWKDINYRDGDQIIDAKARLLSKDESIFHGTDAFKWILNDGREIVINSQKQIETSAEYLGTYNFVNPDNFFKNIDHGVMDVLPYALWGNSPDDATPFFSRVGITQGAQKIVDGMHNWYSDYSSDKFRYDLMMLSRLRY